MLTDYFTWNTPWELYFHILIFIPIIQRLIFLGEPALKAIQLHGHHLRWLFERLKEIPKGYSIAAKFTVGLLVPATIALMKGDAISVKNMLLRYTRSVKLFVESVKAYKMIMKS